MQALARLLQNYMSHAPKCLFHLVTGYYCPGCGGTRALYLFLTGHWIKSFLFHPLVVYAFFVCLYLCIRKILDHKYHPNARLLWIALGLLAVNFVIKNLALVCFHVDLLQIF